jgi:hypothetical protein
MIEQVDVLDGAKELQYVLSEVADDRMSDKALDCADPADNHGAVKAQPIMHGVAMAHPIMHGATSIGGANAPIQHKIHGTPTTNGARAMPYSSISTSTGGTHDAVPGAAVRSAGVAHVITPSILTSTNDMSKVALPSISCETFFSVPNKTEIDNLRISKVMGVSPTNKPSMEEVISFGGISRCSDMGMRSSDRIRRQPNADATQMERAMDLAQRRDDTSGQGKNLNCKLSFASFSDDEIIAKASMLDVSMGASHVDCIGAAKMIKDLEYQRALTFLNVNEIPEDNCLQEHLFYATI